ncbi:SDR family NAD(P)-dependent oxidoreductase [Kitasatospora sp. NPDC101157]|uniref:SDR family NAD(P)-dependent oxidoreductase n=1 Tax=Kitasatospora sp. NPDC101157 TaxID=3364098 RepID=UPI0037F793D2
MTQFSLDDKVVVVTGAETDTGAAVAAELARRGAAVAVQYATSFARAKQVVRDIEQAGGQAVAIKADLQDPAQTELLCKKAWGAFGDVDVVVTTEPDHPEPQPAADPATRLAETVRLRLTAALGPMYAALPAMTLRGTGALVHLGAPRREQLQEGEAEAARAVAAAAMREAMDRLAREAAPRGLTAHLLPADPPGGAAHAVALLLAAPATAAPATAGTGA